MVVVRSVPRCSSRIDTYRFPKQAPSSGVQGRPPRTFFRFLLLKVPFPVFPSHSDGNVSQEPDLDFRKAAYRQFALCRHGKLGRGKKRVMPSCVVLQIRHTYWFPLSSCLFIFWIFNYLSADTSTLLDAGKIGHVTGYLIQWTLDNSNLQGKSKKVRVFGSSMQITGSKEISKWTGSNGNQGTMYTGMDAEFELEWQKSKDKEFTRLFWNKYYVSDFSTRFFFPTCHALITWFELSRVTWRH